MMWRKINVGMFSLFAAVMLLITSNVLLAHSNENSQQTISSCNSSALIHFLQSPMNLQQEIAYSDTADTSDTSSDSSSSHGYSLIQDEQPINSYASLSQGLEPHLITQFVQSEQSTGNTVTILAQDLQSKLRLTQTQTDSVETILINYQTSLHSSASALTPGAQGKGMRMADPKATANSRIEALLTNAQKSTWSTIRGNWWKEVDTKLGS